MKIIRSQKPSEHYTVIRNDILRDESLSFRARGILTYILSNVDTWRTDATTLSKIGGEGRQAIQTAINELKSAGYIESKKVQDPLTGRWTTEVTVYDIPKHKREKSEALDTETSIAIEMVRDIWETTSHSEQPPIAVVKIVAAAIKRGEDKKALSKALDKVAKSGKTLTAERLQNALNNRIIIKGKLAADARVDWNAIGEEL